MSDVNNQGIASKLIVDYVGVNISLEDNVILNNVNCQILENEFVYLVGKVGSGKSTFLKSLYGEAKTEGEAFCLGRNMSSIKSGNIPKLRRQMGIIFQDYKLLEDRSIYDNMLFVLQATGWTKKDEIEACIERALKDSRLTVKAYKYPYQLSGGEQQRAAIARATLNTPKILIADEPTGNLDPQSVETIMELLFLIKSRGSAVLMSTHNQIVLSNHTARTLEFGEGTLIVKH